MRRVGREVGALYSAVKMAGRRRAVRQRDRLPAFSYASDMKLSEWSVRFGLIKCLGACPEDSYGFRIFTKTNIQEGF